MRYSQLLSVVAFLLFVVSWAAAGPITGVFQGVIVQLPHADAKAGVRWMYVQGKNGAIRRANIAKATIEYDEDYPTAKRHRKAAESLRQATEVRVTAEQDEARDGEWQATNVLIMAPQTGRKNIADRSTTVARK